jgi:hypothetical protein
MNWVSLCGKNPFSLRVVVNDIVLGVKRQIKVLLCDENK